MNRYYVQLVVEVDADDEESAAIAVERVAATVTRQDWFNEPGFVSLSIDDRGDGPIVEQNEEA